MSTKELALESIRVPPEHVTWSEIEDRIHFVAAIEKGRDDIRQRNVVPHEEVRASLLKWLSE